MDKLFNSRHLVSLIGKWRYHLLVIVIITAILAMIFSGPSFITPKYESHAIAYPANVEPYSDESETEQMLQILNSQDIIDSMVNKFDLAKQ
jgi:capsular polysaccharide biosynthesis protein